MDIEEIIERAKVDGFMLQKTQRPDDPGAEGCWFGGKPTLPEDIEWPWTKGAYQQPSIPLHFIAQIKLDSVPWHDGLPEMPHTGTLFFFADTLFGPAAEYRNDSAKIIYVPQDVLDVPECSMPSGFPRNTGELPFKSHLYGDGRTAEYRKWNFEFVPRIAYNCWKCQDYLKITEGFPEALGKKIYEEEERLLKTSFSTHCMFAGPHPRNPNERVEPYTWTTEKIPLLGMADDDELGFSIGICDYGLVFNIAKDQLKDGIFEPVFAMPTNEMV